MECKVGHNIRRFRKNLNLTQNQLGDKVNITRQTLSNYEVGKRLSDLIMLIKFADVFNVTIDELVGRKKG